MSEQVDHSKRAEVMTQLALNMQTNVRTATSKRLRFEVFKRDGFACAYCGRTPPTVLLECDHVDPVSNGGATEIDNLVTACFDCNRGKADVLLSDVPQSMAERAAEVLEREAQIAGYQAIMKQRRLRIEAEVAEVALAFDDAYCCGGLSARDNRTIRTFIERLGLEECLEAVSKAEAKCSSIFPGFKYFCGVCWGKIRDREVSAS